MISGVGRTEQRKQRGERIEEDILMVLGLLKKKKMITKEGEKDISERKKL